MEKFEGLTPIYKAIKAGLKPVVDTAVDWFNAQIDTVQVDERGVWVEFPDEIEFEEVTKQLHRAPLRVRVYVYVRALAEVDGFIPQAETEAHDALALQVRDVLRYKALFVKDGDFFAEDFNNADFFTGTPSPGQLTKRLRFVGWQHYHRERGMLLTHIDFMTEVEA